MKFFCIFHIFLLNNTRVLFWRKITENKNLRWNGNFDLSFLFRSRLKNIRVTGTTFSTRIAWNLVSVVTRLLATLRSPKQCSCVVLEKYLTKPKVEMKWKFWSLIFVYEYLYCTNWMLCTLDTNLWKKYLFLKLFFVLFIFFF